MTVILDPRSPADPAEALLADVHEAAEQQIAAARRVAAERDIAVRQLAALERRLAEVEHQNRELRKANESWRARFEDAQRTLELPRYPAEPAPKRRGRWRR